jgi:NADH-quinone oxidoreductase chain G
MVVTKSNKININNKGYIINQGLTLIQACNSLGFEIPRFCYHEKLTIAGNCRMCLIEISRPRGPVKPKPAASCGLPITEGMYIHTNTILVKKARESVLEFLLINHPLDCPICDQGGECDLQDQTIIFGSDRGRFYESKRTVSDKECGPLIRTSMTRCIHCTRCVRFGNEIAGVDFLGTTGRGYFTEIGPYINEMTNSELSGNIIDLCPVGALTSKPYTFKSRPWELKKIETIDILDSLCSNIRIDLRGLEIMRILPRTNEAINEDWITDKTRFCYDGLKKQRINKPLINLVNKYINVSWKGIFLWIGYKLKEFKKHFIFNGIIGKFVENESIIVLKDFLNKYGSSNYYNETISKINIDFRNNFLLNTKITYLEDIDFCILIGFNPRLELPLLNTRLRKAVRNKNCFIILYGYANNLTYKFYNISNNIIDFFKFIEGKSVLCRKFLKIHNPILLKGNSLLYRIDNLNFEMLFDKIFTSFNKKFKIINNFINIYSGFINSFELGFLSNKNICINKKKINVLFLLNVDENSLFKYLIKIKKQINSFLIYQGNIGNDISEISDVLFPSCNFIEQTSSFINIEGRLQYTKFIQYPTGLIRSDWKIILALSLFLKKKLNFLNLYELKKRFLEISPLLKFNIITSNNKSLKLEFYENHYEKLYIYNYPLLSPYFNYYKTDLISKTSQILNLTSKKFVKNINFYNLKI